MTPKTIGRRRNGKQQACEPCRKSKQSCSHTLPHCDRCVKSNKTAECFYHEAPMTKGYIADDPSSLRNSSSTPSKRALSVGSSSPTPTSSHKSKSLKESIGPPPLPNHARVSKAHHRWGTTSAFGSTSFSAIFRENQDKFGRDIFDAPNSHMPDTNTASPEHQKRLNKCIRVLHAYPSMETCERLLDTFATTKNPLLSMPLIRAANASLWETFGQLLTGERTDAQLREIADVVAANAAIPWTCIGDNSFGDWPNICCGRQLRWEMLGLLFACFGLSFMHLQGSDRLFAHLGEVKNGRQKMAWRMQQCAEECLNVCDDSETLNETVINLMRHVMLLDSFFWGNDSARVARRRAMLVQAVFCSGIHSMPKAPFVTAATEHRARVFMNVYDVDKMLSCVYGQPPLMSQDYCMMVSPLDLSDDQLLGDTKEIADAAKRLDENGWNTAGKIYEVTTLRARFELSRVKEEIQKICLGTMQDGKKDGIDELFQKLEATVAAFPSQLRYKNPAPNVDDREGAAVYSQCVLHLEYLQLRFHVERLRMQRRKGTSQGLFDTAKAMLETITTIYTESRLQLTAHWFDWLLVSYGYPAAGALILTAMTSIRSSSLRTANSSMPVSMPSSQVPPSSQMSNVSSGTTASQPRNPSQLLGINFSLPEVITLLTDFFAFLAWCREADTNNPPASQVETVMRKLTIILEQSLSQPSSQQPRSANSSFGGLNMLYPRSANSSFGAYPMGVVDSSSSQIQSFDFNGSLTTSGAASLGNTQLTTPTLDSFEAPSSQEYLTTPTQFDEATWGLDPLEMEDFLSELDPTILTVGLGASGEVADYGVFLNGYSSSFGPGLGMSQ